jgi:urease accessory protein
MPGSEPLRSDVFTANRARGRVAFTVAAGPRGSRRERVHEAGSLRVRFPNGNPQTALDAVLVNTAGGMTGGDRFDIDIGVGAAASLTVTTAAAEKIYRSLGPDTAIDVKLAVGPGGSLNWLPQETIVFDQVRLRRAIDVTLAREARLLLAEATIFGRSAMGETVAEGSFFDSRRVRVDGTLVLAECNRLDGEIAQRLAQHAVAKGGVGVASVIKVPGNETDAEAVRALQNDFAGEVGVSAWNGLAVVRLVAPDGAPLRRDLAALLTALDAGPLPRLWLN